MRNYELLFILKPTLTEEELKAQGDAILESIKNNGGEVLAVNHMGAKKLAYAIEKQQRGVYTVVYFNGEASSIKELERLLRINENVLRFMTVKYENKVEVKAFNDAVAKVNRLGAATETKEEATKEEAAAEA
jgi:small subunit ribosomal protein S6